jgi:hypothetical protein
MLRPDCRQSSSVPGVPAGDLRRKIEKIVPMLTE